MINYKKNSELFERSIYLDQIGLNYRFRVRTSNIVYIKKINSNEQERCYYGCVRYDIIQQVVSNPTILGINEQFSDNMPARFAFDIDGISGKIVNRMVSKVKESLTTIFDQLGIVPPDPVARSLGPHFTVFHRYKGKDDHSIHIHELRYIFSGGSLTKFIKPVVS